MEALRRKVGGLKPKSILDQHYEVKEVLGSGTFSTVKQAVNRRTGERVAVKIIEKKSVGDKLDMLNTEVDILKRVHHANVIMLRELFETTNKLYLVMELVTGGELFDSIVERGSYTEKDASELTRDIVSAVAYLHEQGIVHRDLKPENLLYSSKNPDAIIKIADFGLSKMVEEDTMLKTACGTPGYVAPEVLKCEGYGTPVDMWSIGVILYILLCGFPPFYDDNTAVLFEQIMGGKYDFPSPYWDEVSEGAKDLIKKLLTVDPKKRLIASEALEHPWIKSGGDDRQLTTAQEEMKKFNARRRFKMAIHATIATKRMAAATAFQKK